MVKMEFTLRENGHKRNLLKRVPFNTKLKFKKLNKRENE